MSWSVPSQLSAQWPALSALAAAVGVSSVLAACTAPSSKGEVTGVTEVTMTATEFKLAPSRMEFTAGVPVRLTFDNQGMLEHDWDAPGFPVRDVQITSAPGATAAVMEKMQSFAAQGIPHPIAAAGQRVVVQFTPTTPGTFEVICQIPGHKEGGMVAQFVVREGSVTSPPAGQTFQTSAVPASEARAATAPVARLANPEVASPVLDRPAAVVPVEVEIKEVAGLIDEGVAYRYWTFGGTVPGPMIRVRQGDTVELTLKNPADSTVSHSIDLHAVTGPGGGAGATQIGPGQEATFRFQALNPGVYVYHCATPIHAVHVANGMYGLIVVEPAGGLPAVDRELYVMQGDFYLDGSKGEPGEHGIGMAELLDERPDYVVFNGSSGSLAAERALQARVGETVRIFFGVGGPNLSSSFHVIGEIFDRIYPEGSSEALTNVQTTLVPAGGATMVEFTAEVPGDYILVDHSLSRLLKGAAAILQVRGDADPLVFQPIRSTTGPATSGPGH